MTPNYCARWMHPLASAGRLRHRTLGLLAAGLLALFALPAPAFEPGLATIDLRIDGIRIGYQQQMRAVLPGEQLLLETAPQARIETTIGVLTPQKAGRWLWTAHTEPGHGQLTVTVPDVGQTRITLFVMRPWNPATESNLSGYRIGAYPRKPLRGNPIYNAPPGFIEVTQDMVDLPVSPHFRLGEFLCKQQPDHWPKYLRLRPGLLNRLERILHALNEAGVASDRLVVMSGFRTPWYNAQIQNVEYSRHVWGGAADVYIDRDGDGQMDDLNGDGVTNFADTLWLRDLIRQTFSEVRDTATVAGGLGVYGPRPHRGPFVHVDARGEDAYWSIP